MNEATPRLPDPIERLLAEHLNRQAARLGTEELHDRIMATLATERLPSPASRTRAIHWARWAGGVSIVACLLVTGLMFWQGEQALKAHPQALLQETHKTLLQPVYRCYAVEVQREAGLTDDTNPMIAQSRQSRLWTRGDRFWIETTFPDSSGQPNYWGRDEHGNIRMTFGAAEGIEITPGETPRWLRVFSDLCSMQPDRLIVEVLHDFDLRREESPAGSRAHIIKAEPKPGRSHSALKGAVLEIDADTKVLQRVVVYRTTSGSNLTATFTLVDTKTQDEIQSPLDGPGTREFYSGDFKPEERKRLLLPLFGHRITESIKPSKK